jgi:hypothetical protein
MTVARDRLRVTMRLAAGSHVFLKRGGTQLGGFNPQRLFL